MQLIGVWQGEKYFRVQGRGENRYCVILWLEDDEPMAQCTCEAFYIPQDPTHCFHVGAVLIYEATEEAPKLASMGRKEKTNEAAQPSR